MKKLFSLSASVCLLAYMLVPAMAEDAALEAFKNQAGEINIAGGTAHLSVMQKAAKKIMAYNPDIHITVAGGGSGAGIEKVADGSIQIGNTGRPLTKDEIEEYGLVTFPIAIDGVAVAVNPQNPVSNLSMAQLKAIFSGEIKNWKEVGGKDTPVSLYTRDPGSGVLATFEEKATGPLPRVPGARILTSNAATKNAIMYDPNAIGVLGIGHLTPNIKGLNIDGMVPSQRGAANGDYSITRALYMNTKGQPEGIVKSFIDYIYSPEGETLIREAGYLPMPRPQK